MKNENKTNEAMVRRRRRQQGMTLIEIMIVIVIIGLVGTGVTVAFMGQFKKANQDTAKTEACTIRSAVTLYMAQNAGDCPSVDDLKGTYLDKGKRTTDPWGQEYVIECEGGEVEVYSGGEGGSGRISCGGESEE